MQASPEVLNMVTAFLDQIERAEIRDVPALRALLFATPADTGPVLAPPLMSIEEQAPEMVDSLPAPTIAVLDVLGQAIEDAEHLDDAALLDQLVRFAAGMKTVLGPLRSGR